MTFNPMNFVTNLRYLAVGMVSIFAVIGVIVLITVILNKIFTQKDWFWKRGEKLWSLTPKPQKKYCFSSIYPLNLLSKN